tara:strand:- start:800 stop:1174 length:375 start_codon:yes stop_codon:yes gene_type:complete
MTNYSDLIEVLSRAVSNGINMDKYNIFECNLFMKELHEHLNLETNYVAHYAKRKITVETIAFTPLLSIELEKTTIQCIPITDEGWVDVVYEVIKFFHKKNMIEKENEKAKAKKLEEENKEFDWI